MTQQTIVRNQFFFFIADESDIVYNYSTVRQNSQLQKERTRARFLVELLEKPGYEASNIHLDFEWPQMEILGLVDLVAFKNGQAFLVAQTLADKPSVAELSLAMENILEKAKELKAKYAVLLWDNKKEIFSLQKGRITKTSSYS